MSHFRKSFENDYDFRTDSYLQKSIVVTQVIELSKPRISLFKKSYYFSTLKNSTSVTYDISMNIIKLSGSEELINKRMLEIYKWQSETKILHVDVQKKFGEKLAKLLPFLERINESNEIQVEECNEHLPNHECLALFYNEIDKEGAIEEFSKRLGCSWEGFDLSQDRIKTCIHGISLSVISGDITEEEVDVIVCSVPANLANLKNGIMSNAVLQKSGPALQEACNKKGSLKQGDIFVTDKFNLQYCKNIFLVTLGHVKTHKNLIPQIEKLLTYCLEKAVDEKVMSIAFPTIGFGFLKRRCKADSDLIKAYFDSIKQFAKNHNNNNNHLKEIKFVIKDDSLFKDFKMHLKGLLIPTAFGVTN